MLPFSPSQNITQLLGMGGFTYKGALQGGGMAALQPYRRRSLCQAYAPRKRTPGKAKEHLSSQGFWAGDVKLPPSSSSSLFLCQQPMQGDQIFIASVELNNTSM